jgi:hypothetical protein
VLDGVGSADRDAESTEQVSKVVKLALGIVYDPWIHGPAAKLALLAARRKVWCEGWFKGDVEGPSSRPDDDLL